jgi:AcrR family transcriptional regulator
MVNDDKPKVKSIEDEIPGLYAPQQGRSHRAMSRVLTHFHRLLKQKPFAEIQMSAVSQATGVGVGTRYFRFSSKEYLLIALAAKVVREEI